MKALPFSLDLQQLVPILGREDVPAGRRLLLVTEQIAARRKEIAKLARFRDELIPCVFPQYARNAGRAAGTKGMIKR